MDDIEPIRARTQLPNIASPDTESVDVLVVGASFAGLSAAKVYLACDPDANLVIVDYGTTLGGVWAKERLYPGLKSNNLLGTFELPDYPIHEGFGVKPGEHIPGEVLHAYLNEYATVFGLIPRLRLRTKVISAEKLDNAEDAGWRVVLESRNDAGSNSTQKSITTKKLIIATGLTSQPEPLHIAGQENLEAPIVVQPQLGRSALEVFDQATPETKIMTVIGGSKSAYDAVYLFASNGFHVNWIIRKSGYGPTWMAPTHMNIGPRRFWLERLTSVRFLSWFSPCIWGETKGSGSWARRFLHGTKIGRWVVDTFWAKLSSDTLDQSGLLCHPSLKPLIPDSSMFDTATSLAILNYPTNFHDLIISGQVEIHREDISHLSKHTVHLTNGTVLPSPSGLIAGANWACKPNLTFLPKSLESDLGIPSTYTPTQEAFWHALDTRADAEICARLPRLKKNHHFPTQKQASEAPTTPPIPDATALTEEPTRLQPFRLYRYLAPPGLTAQGDRSIVFAGFAANLLGHVRNEIAGLWCYAYLNRELEMDRPFSLSDPSHPSDRSGDFDTSITTTASNEPSEGREDLEKELPFHYSAALTSRFCAFRFPYGFGSRYPDFVFEQVAWFDVLLRDLGLPVRRKSLQRASVDRSGLRAWWPVPLTASWWKAWCRETFEPYGQVDYRGLTGEWLALRRKVE